MNFDLINNMNLTMYLKSTNINQNSKKFNEFIILKTKNYRINLTIGKTRLLFYIISKYMQPTRKIKSERYQADITIRAISKDKVQIIIKFKIYNYQKAA